MPCKEAIITDVTTIKPDQTVEAALNIFSKKGIRYAPVVSDEGIYLGMFGYIQMLKGVLPVSVTMEDGLNNLDFIIGSSPGVAKRLRKLKKKTISECMEINAEVVTPETSLWEAIRIMFSTGGTPLAVVVKNNREFYGLMTEQSTLAELDEIIKELEAEEAL
jgi:CBS domain-containing protein